MSQISITFTQVSVVEDEIRMTLVELCHACNVGQQQVMDWVFAGVLEPSGDSPGDWLFGGDSLRRAKMALRLSRDMEINPPGVALALDLLDEIASLRARLQR